MQIGVFAKFKYFTKIGVVYSEYLNFRAIFLIFLRLNFKGIPRKLRSELTKL